MGLVALAGLAALVLTVVGLVLTVRNGWRTRKTIRRERREALVRREYSAACAQGLHQARAMARTLADGAALDPLTVWGPVLRPSETAYLDLWANLAELTTVAAGQTAWGPRISVQLLGTDERLFCNAGVWFSVWYDELVGFYPDLDRSTVVLDIANAPAVRLTGPLAPVIAVFVGYRVYGRERLVGHSEFAALFS